MNNKRIPVDEHVVSSLLPDLVGHDRSPAAFIVYLYLSVRAGDRRSRKVGVSLQGIANDTGLSKSAVQMAVKTLLRRRLLRVEKTAPTAVPYYEVLRPWARSA